MVMSKNSGGAPGIISDRELVDRILNGDQASFELIMRRYNRRLYRIARGILRNETDAEDAVQEAYVKAYRNLDRYQGSGAFSAWIARITVNEALGRLRRKDAVQNNISLDNPVTQEEANHMAEMTFPGPTPEQSTARSEIRQLLEAAIDALPETYRLVFVLRGIEEMTISETSECLMMEPATVKSRFHRARKMLQQSLSGYDQWTTDEAFPFAGARCDRIVMAVFKRLGILDRE